MKVLMTCDTIGGVWTYALYLARALAAYRCSVTLAAMGRPASPAQRREAQAIPDLELVESDCKLEWMDNPWDDVARSGRWLLDLEEQTGPDLIHINGYAHGALPFRAPVIVVAHSCVLSWWQAVRGEPAPRTWSRYKQEVSRGLRGADLVLAPTVAMLSTIQQHYGPLDARTAVIPNGRDPALFARGGKRSMILSAGRVWDEAKNIRALADIARELSWPVHVAGDATSPQGAATALDGVNVLGPLDPPELRRWMSRAAIYALPAKYEPFGLSILEAAFSGCALVVGDIPSLREVWGDAAAYVAPEDSHGLLLTLRSLIANPRRRTDLAHRAFARASQYTLHRMGSRYLATYRDVLHQSRRAEAIDRPATPPIFLAPR